MCFRAIPSLDLWPMRITTVKLAPQANPPTADSAYTVADTGLEGRALDVLIDVGPDVSGPRSSRNSDMAVVAFVMLRRPMSGGLIGSVDLPMWCVTYTF